MVDGEQTRHNTFERPLTTTMTFFTHRLIAKHMAWAAKQPLRDSQAYPSKKLNVVVNMDDADDNDERRSGPADVSAARLIQSSLAALSLDESLPQGSLPAATIETGPLAATGVGQTRSTATPTAHAATSQPIRLPPPTVAPPATPVPTILVPAPVGVLNAGLVKKKKSIFGGRMW